MHAYVFCKAMYFAKLEGAMKMRTMAKMSDSQINKTTTAKKIDDARPRFVHDDEKDAI